MKKGLRKGILFLPVVLSVGWIVLLRQGVHLQGEQFAPGASNSLILALVIFTVGYLLFLLLLFSDDIKQMFA